MNELKPEQVAARILIERGICTDKKKQDLFFKRQAKARRRIEEIRELNELKNF